MFRASFVGKIVPKSVDKPADRTGGFIEINNMVSSGKFFALKAFVFASDDGNSISGGSNETPHGLVEWQGFGAVAPVGAELGLLGEDRKICGIDVIAFGGILLKLSFGVLSGVFGEMRNSLGSIGCSLRVDVCGSPARCIWGGEVPLTGGFGVVVFAGSFVTVHTFLFFSRFFDFCRILRQVNR